MKITELGGGRARVFYTTAEYAILLVPKRALCQPGNPRNTTSD